MDRRSECTQSHCTFERCAMIDRMQAALAFIPADHRDTWVLMGMAVKSELGESGFDIWDDWSRSAQNYKEASARSVWKSCKIAGGVTAGTLFHEARACGWQDDKQHAKPSFELLQARRDEAAARLTKEGLEIEQAQASAAKKAAWIMHQTKPEQHAYLHSKGWIDAKGPVWRPNERQNLLCVPMRVADNLVGVQLINREGQKRYLTGQKTSKAEYVILNDGRGAVDWFVEGYATGLSLRICLQALRMRYKIHVTFSAGNLVKVAALYAGGLVIADKDDSGTGERVAIETGLPYYLPDKGDLNDLHKELGTFQTSQIIRKWLASVGKRE